jgi:copper(I)-binding protein
MLIGGLALLAVPAVAGCEAGLNAPTLEFHSASAGASANFNGISITNAFVLGPAQGATLPAGSSASVFLGIYNNNNSDDQLVSASSTAASSVTIKGGKVTIHGTSPADLAGPNPTIVLKGLTAPLAGNGETVPVELDFAHAGEVTLNLPVEPHSFYYGTYSPPAIVQATPSGSGTPSPTTTGAGGTSPSGTPSGTATPSGTSSPGASTSPTATPTASSTK